MRSSVRQSASSSRRVFLAIAATVSVACGVAKPASAQPTTISARTVPAAASSPGFSPAEILMRRVPYFSQDKQPIADVMQALGRAYGISVLCEKDLKADIQAEFHNMTLQGILDAICTNEGFYWDLEESGYIFVRRHKTIVYQIEYPLLDRHGKTSASISLGQNSVDGDDSGGGGGGSSGKDNDTATISLDSTTDSKFWNDLQSNLNSLKAGPDESFLFDKFSGTLVATASRDTHHRLSRYLATLNARIGQQVEILGKLVEVQLDDQNKLGVDWSLAKTSIAGNNGSMEFLGSTNVEDALGGLTFADDTIVGTIAMGKVSAVLHALSQQGNLNAVTAPRLVTLNNQTAFIKDTEDRPFFRRTSSYSRYDYGSGSGSAPSYESNEYEIDSVSIGTIVAITPHIADNGDITLDITPAITRLKEERTSPDKASNAPALYVKMASTIVRLRSGETAIIGGILTDSEISRTRSIPGLGSLPLLGRLFRTEAVAKQKSELVIFLTPRILQPGRSLTHAGSREAFELSRYGQLNHPYPAAGASAAPALPAAHLLPSPPRAISAGSGVSRPVEVISVFD
ncbi:type II secretory pathway, component PulD [Opitutaceae bacterium TAV5]|nr:type II secretory pathway, component PulD [Opitutaceae bacterium TAV5]